MGDYEYEQEEAYDNLAERLEVLEQAAQEPDYYSEDDDQELLPYQVAAESRQDGLNAREYLARVAEETRRAVIAEAGVDLSQPVNPRDPVEVALEMVAASIPTWEEDAPA